MFIRHRHWGQLPLKLPHLILQQASKREGIPFLQFTDNKMHAPKGLVTC